ncbi:MAG TPA: hypothetical protein VHN14_30710 [Kofleriaceae bacterium]|nr:hypothetical protein [Kofleriaceae bacterium]
MRRHALRWMCALPVLLALHCSRSPSNSGGAGSAGSAGPTKLTIAAIAIVDVAPLHLGKAKGFFAEQNLDITVQGTQAAPSPSPGW